MTCVRSGEREGLSLEARVERRRWGVRGGVLRGRASWGQWAGHDLGGGAWERGLQWNGLVRVPGPGRILRTWGKACSGLHAV